MLKVQSIRKFAARKGLEVIDFTTERTQGVKVIIGNVVVTIEKFKSCFLVGATSKNGLALTMLHEYETQKDIGE